MTIVTLVISWAINHPIWVTWDAAIVGQRLTVSQPHLEDYVGRIAWRVGLRCTLGARITRA